MIDLGFSLSQNYYSHGAIAPNGKRGNETVSDDLSGYADAFAKPETMLSSLKLSVLNIKVKC